MPKRVLPVAAAGCAFLLVALGVLQSEAPDSARAQLGGFVLFPVATGLDEPVFVTNAGDGSGRLFVVEKAGRVRIIESDGTVAPGDFLNITSSVSESGERGLLSIAFAPGPGEKDEFWAYYLDNGGAITIARIPITGGSGGTPLPIVSIAHPRTNHVGGQVAFGPSAQLYFAIGDGGGSYDPDDNGQDPETLLATLLRVDPFAGLLTEPDLVGIGLRNPWRFSFDGSTLYLADVGQDDREEVNIVPSSALSSGDLNFGWSIVEGDICVDDLPCDPSAFYEPDIVYGHTGGRCSVTGGYVYRGDAIPSLVGQYIYGDFCSGEIFGLGQPLNAGPAGLASFGLDEDGEIYVVMKGSTQTPNGAIYRLEQADEPTATSTGIPTTGETPTSPPGSPTSGTPGETATPGTGTPGATTTGTPGPTGTPGATETPTPEPERGPFKVIAPLVAADGPPP